jgi:hypothetical protein
MADGPLLSGAVSLERQASDMHAAHVGSIRVAFYWSDVQPSAGAAPDFSSTDAVVLAAAKHRIDVLPTVVRAPAWARVDASDPGSPPADPQTYAGFLRALIARYGPGGSFWAAHGEVAARPIRRWQVWNEPDIEKYFTPAKDQNGWAAPYVALLQVAAGAIRAADPGAQVWAAGLTNRSWVDLRKLYAAGGKPWFDVAAIHPFSRRVSNVLKIVRLARQTMKAAGDAGSQLGLTEMSWSSGKGRSHFNYGWETTESGQAARIREVLPALARKRRAWRLAGVWWYTWLCRSLGGNDSFDYAGLRRMGSGGHVVDKPALAAWRSTVARLTH